VENAFYYSPFNLIERPKCAFPARRWLDLYPATVSGRLRQATEWFREEQK
jgi:hypothetical protein